MVLQTIELDDRNESFLIPYKGAVKPCSRLSNDWFLKAFLRMLIYCGAMQLSSLNTLISIKHSHHLSLFWASLLLLPL